MAHNFNQSLDGIQLPSSRQSLTFGDEFNLFEGFNGLELNRSLEGIQLNQQPAELDVWPAEFDAWSGAAPELEGHPTTQQSAES